MEKETNREREREKERKEEQERETEERERQERDTERDAKRETERERERVCVKEIHSVSTDTENLIKQELQRITPFLSPRIAQRQTLRWTRSYHPLLDASFLPPHLSLMFPLAGAKDGTNGSDKQHDQAENGNNEDDDDDEDDEEEFGFGDAWTEERARSDTNRSAMRPSTTPTNRDRPRLETQRRSDAPKRPSIRLSDTGNDRPDDDRRYTARRSSFSVI
jgi:hypothetical protein